MHEYICSFCEDAAVIPEDGSAMYCATHPWGQIDSIVIAGRDKMSYTFRGLTLPDHLKDSLDQYAVVGRPVGGFLEACITNNLSQAINRADEEILASLPAIIGYIYNELPTACWGSTEHYQVWIEKHHVARFNNE